MFKSLHPEFLVLPQQEGQKKLKLIINRLKIYPLNDLKNWPLKSSWLDQVENDLTEKKDVNWMDANLPGHVRKRDLENWTRTYQSQFLSSHFWQYQGIDFSSVVF